MMDWGIFLAMNLGRNLPRGNGGIDLCLHSPHVLSITFISVITCGKQKYDFVTFLG
jgi:hypothetical protein